MKKQKFRAPLLTGHKEAAVEVPFDPRQRWGIAATPLWRGRRGYHVQGHLKGRRFESVMVPRSGKWFMLVDEKLQETLGVSIGDLLDVAVEPNPSPAKPAKSRS